MLGVRFLLWGNPKQPKIFVIRRTGQIPSLIKLFAETLLNNEVLPRTTANDVVM